MTKKHFISLANYMRACEPFDISSVSSTVSHQQWERDVRALANFCARWNPRFKRERWLDYIDGKCGPGGGKV